MTPTPSHEILLVANDFVQGRWEEIPMLLLLDIRLYSLYSRTGASLRNAAGSRPPHRGAGRVNGGEPVGTTEAKVEAA
jgi:hypothetical protein